MESIIYEKDYSMDVKEEAELPEAFVALEESGFFSFYDTLMGQLPKRVVEKDKETYERVLEKCDAYAQRVHGKVYGIVDYEKWESHIYLTLPWLEVADDADRAFLKDIIENVTVVTFEPAEEGKIVVKMLINYFEEVMDSDMSDGDIEKILLAAIQAGGQDTNVDEKAMQEMIDAFRMDMEEF